MFAGDSPFVFEEDAEDVAAISMYDRSYVLYVSSEHPPYIAASAVIGENRQVDSTGLMGTSEAYLMSAEAEGRNVRFIDDSEAEAIIKMLADLSVDVEQTVSIREPDLDAVAERLFNQPGQASSSWPTGVDLV